MTPFKKTDFTSQSSKKVLHKNESKAVVYNTLSIDERKQLFLQTLQPFETKYDNDYIRTFTEYWLAENMGRLRIEVNENGNQMNLLGITPDYMDMKLEHWKQKYDIIVTARRTPFILDEIKNEAKAIEKEYASKSLELRCNTIMDDNYSVGSDRLIGKLLFDRGLFRKRHYEYDSFLQKGTEFTLCYPIESIEEQEEKSFTVFCLLYEAKQAFKENKDYNRSVLSSIDPQLTYKSFCDKYGIRYAGNLKNDKSIKEMVNLMKFPIEIDYNYGQVLICFNHTSHRKFLLKLNEIFGLKLFVRNWFIGHRITVPYKVLYKMDGTQFDFRDDSFEYGTMKSVKLPTDYKDAQFYIDKIEEILLER